MSKGGGKGAFFLDRDGTINFDRVYINDPGLIELIPGAAGAIRRAQDAGFVVVVVTNQSGIGRGLIEPKVLPLIHDRVDELLANEAGARIDRYQFCVHHPDENCACRKPKPKLVNDACQELGLDPARSVFVGDTLTDVGAGKNAHCRFSLLVRSGKGNKEELRLQEPGLPPEFKPDAVVDDLAAAVDWALARL